MPEKIHQLADILLDIEREMRRIERWEQQQPPPQALLSTMPFCCDTLTFEQWLQWIFLPRMKVLLEEGAALPAVSGIFPMAEECLGDVEEVRLLLTLIQRFDTLITDME